jgi:hypothetical protein
LTRAQAFESLRKKVAELDEASERAEPEQPLAEDRIAPPRDDRARQDLDGPLSGQSDPPLPPGLADRPDDQRNYWTEVPRFLFLWNGHRERWPERPGNSPNWSLEPDHSRRAKDAIAEVTAAEPAVSGAVKEIESANERRGWLEGFRFRLKGPDRLEEKVASAYETSSPDATISEIVEQIPDAIRYTFCFSDRDYTTGYHDVKDRLEERGYHMYKSRNSWDEPEYKGINTRWVTPGGQRFEVQFHTPESFHAKHEVTHEAYERIRDPRTSDTERRELSIFQQDVSSWIPVPDRVSSIADHSEEGY